MKKYFRGIIISAAVIFCSVAGVTSVQAADCGELGDDCLTRWYVGITGGEGSLSSDGLAAAFTAVDETDIAYGIVGGRRFNKFLGLELNGNYFGEPDYAGLDDLRICNLGFGANLYLPLGAAISDPNLNFISLFGRAGMHYWDAEAEVGGTTVFDDDGVDAFYGGGLNIDLARLVTLRAEYTTYEIGSDDYVSTKSLTVLIKF